MAKNSLQKELEKLLSIIDEKMVARFDAKTGAVFIGGERADQARLANLKSEAEFLIQTDLWKILNHSIRQLAEQAMFVSGESLDDMKKGRSILFMLDSQKRMVELFKSFVLRQEIRHPGQMDGKVLEK